ILTKYLVQYKRVSIPHIGTFEIVQQSPELHIGDKLITAPLFTTKYVNNDQVTDHQFHFIENCEQLAKDELSSFGENLNKMIRKHPFYWNGFGTLRYDSSRLVFDPLSIELNSLSNIIASKVTRKNVRHSMLVGDLQMTGQQVTEVFNQPELKKPKEIYMTVGWIIFIIAIIGTAVVLYLGRFQVSATGLRW
ncbi:MAG: hypothetical protein ACXWCZ_09800, partial [Flavisolibacter sp.]